MAIEIVLESLATPGPPEDRLFANLSVTKGENTYKWGIFVPMSYMGNIGEYIEISREKIEQQITAKEAEWEALDPKTITVNNPLTDQSYEVEVKIEDVVRPNIPDYYAKRRNEYPSIPFQLDAIWKGTTSQAYIDMQELIQSIKEKYPKE